MKWQEVWQQLEQKEVAPCYLLTGEETYLISQTVSKIEAALELGELRDFNMEQLEAADIDSTTLAAAVAQAPWLAGRRLVVVRGLNPRTDNQKTAGKVAAGSTDLWEQLPLIIAALSPAVCLVLCVNGSVDKRTKVVKAAASMGKLVEFPYLRGRELEQWILQRGNELGLSWEGGALSYLIQRTGQGLAQLELELQKLAAYTEGTGLVRRREIELLVPESRESRVFALTDAVLAKNREQALYVLEELLRQGEKPIALVGLLAYQVRVVGLAKAALEQGTASRDVAKTLKVHPFVAQKAVAQSRRFGWDELYDLIRKLAAADLKLKSTALPAQLVLEEVILS